MKKSLSLFACIFGLLGLNFAQQATDKIELKKFNEKLFTNLILDKINVYRDSLNFHKLTIDSVLTLSAKNHSEYVKKTDDLGHLQPNAEFSTLEKRIDYFKGAQEQVAEVVDVLYLDKPTQLYKSDDIIKLYTYEEAADFYFKNSLKIAAHYEIILNKIFYTTGIAFGINEERKCIFVVQVLGSKAFNFHHSVKHKKNKKTFYPSKKINIENAYGVLPYNENVCRKCIEKLIATPAHISYGLTVENSKIYFNFSDEIYFNKLFQDGTESFAVDVVHVDQFTCGTGNMLHRSDIYDGIMLKPLSKSEVVKNNLLKDKNQIKVYMGDCPFPNKDEYELALLIIKDNSLCDYKISYTLSVDTTKIMAIDFYSDTLSKSEILKKKSLRFIIPFERGKFDYQNKDIKPFYDSLQLNKFNIKELSITAYSSVEGTTEKNLTLQKSRAQSIVKVLQSFQLDSIKTVIRTLENWDQFFRELKGTTYAWMASLDKPTIKTRLQEDTVLVALEPLLKRQRKAFITLKVEEKIDLTKDYQELIKHYMTALSKKDLTNASLLQSSLFDAVTNRDIKYAIIGLIAIPKIKEFAQLINNDILFRYQSKETGDFIKEMEDASALDPSNSFIKFNLYNLQLNSWADGSVIVTNPDPIIKNIKALFTSKVDKKIVNQLYLNYYILVTDFYKTTNKFKYREESVALVKKYYKTIEASQQDINLLAKFFMTHGKNEVALELLQPVIENGEYSEDILFTYLSIILNQYKNYEKYSTISLANQAKELNNKRFCTLINGDKTKFQLFKSLPLKEAYCETCRE